ncbi:M36 family metallopeptidase [Aquimarina intermedia]|uniref:Putative secreted protein (Por secretion system target) n=1 Tax=Aquimarina intermedia TaxID=350814 RepID=A0A5S5CA07_9FLAO|nr:M36 family metallopeptidase [Aquimarina intermedia]TYP76235.1 putative secreted protein (Por secretion system target) [Aquimarina intermedia]
MKKMYFFVLLNLFIGQSILAQSIMDGVVQNHFNNVTAKSAMTAEDVSEWKVTNVVPSLNPDIQHVYVQQYYQGIPIQYATYKLTVKNNNQVTWEIDQFVKGLKSKVTTSRSSFSAEGAIMNVAKAHNLGSPKLSRSMSRSNDAFVYEDSGISLEPIKARQVYLKHDDQLILTWHVSIYEKDGQHWWNANVDAASGEILYTEDWVITCNFDTPDHETHNHDESVLLDNNFPTVLTEAEATAALAPDSYNVYAMPIESPSHGNRSVVTDPANSSASPFGWHDTNGSAGAEYTITRGNNVWAQEDRNGNNGTGFSPDGGSNLDFNFPINLTQAPATYDDAAITNLFYWNNIMHDVFYQYGFNEASGNFQENNYGKGGVGGDSVNADAQDGSGSNNANFATPGDGGNPRMQMFLWTSPNPDRDGDLDNGIIAHEYGHGISIRLVGGPSSNTLGGSEQMGEGWSDWFGLMLTMKAGDSGTDPRGIGTYALNQPTNGDGIRPTPYSIDRSINNTDYADIGGLARPHGVGYAFATILWDMTWGLIDAEGFDPDFYNGTGGNNIALALVIEGLKNTANNPGFVSGRDGILQADQDLYGGQYSCIIWKAFSERGVGQDADENNNGGSNQQTDQTVSFINPCDGGGPGPGGDECSGDVASFPYSESFEGNIGVWSQASGDDLDWTINSNSTPSTGTGPSSAADGTSYIYVEASGNGNGFPNKRAILNSPCLNFSGLSTPVLSFQYHMVGNAVGTLAVEARTDNTGDWTSVFTRTGAQGTNWNTANIDLSAYAGNASVQLRLNTVTGTSWQGDVSIDDLSISNGSIVPDPTCESVNFNNFSITSFATQDAAGNFSIVNSGNGLSLSNNTWKYISFNYTVTANTVIEFDFSSTSQGEIHGIAFENDNTLTSTRVIKVHGTQNYGITNYDNYSGGTTTYIIPVGSFYTGNMDRLVFINDNDAGSGNNSTFTNVKIYEGSCGGSAAVVADFGLKAPIYGDEDENDMTGFTIAPNPLKGGSMLQITMENPKTAKNSYSIMNLFGRIVARGTLNSNSTINVGNLKTGMYLLNIQGETQRFIIE